MDFNPVFSNAYKRYALLTLAAVYALSMIDQGLIGLVLDPIKDDLHLTDSQLGLLTGIAFGVVYALIGVPIARAADVGNRSTLAAVALALWGIAVTLYLFVTNFIQLVAMRIVTAVGGAGGMPPTYSLVGDYFPAPAERTRAMTLYMLANPVSLLASFMLGGWLNDRYGWRGALFLMGVPALMIAGLVKLTIAEPRVIARMTGPVTTSPPQMRWVISTLWHRRSARHLSAGLILVYTLGMGLAPWYAAFMMRSHGMQTGALGVWLGLGFGLGGAAGVWLGGHVVQRWFADNERAQVRFIAVSVVALLPCFAFFLLVRDRVDALLWFFPLTVLLNVFFGPAFALMQRLVSDEMRATTLAIVMLACNLVGAGLGPEVVGGLSDWWVPVAGMDSLRYAMLSLCSVTLWAAYHLWQSGSTVERDLAAVNVAITVKP